MWALLMQIITSYCILSTPSTCFKLYHACGPLFVHDSVPAFPATNWLIPFYFIFGTTVCANIFHILSRGRGHKRPSALASGAAILSLLLAHGEEKILVCEGLSSSGRQISTLRIRTLTTRDSRNVAYSHPQLQPGNLNDFTSHP